MAAHRTASLRFVRSALTDNLDRQGQDRAASSCRIRLCLLPSLVNLLDKPASQPSHVLTASPIKSCTPYSHAPTHQTTPLPPYLFSRPTPGYHTLHVLDRLSTTTIPNGSPLPPLGGHHHRPGLASTSILHLDVLSCCFCCRRRYFQCSIDPRLGCHSCLIKPIASTYRR